MLRDKEEELARVVSQWEEGLVSIQVLADLKEEVDALRDLERAIFDKAYPVQRLDQDA